MKDKELLAYLYKLAQLYDFDIDLMLAFALKESSYNPFATRYEKHFIWFWKKESLHHKYKSDLKDYGLRTYRDKCENFLGITEFNEQSKSFGIFQIMGATARWLGYDKEYLAGLYNIEENVKYFVKYFNYQLKRYKGNKHDAISAYNQGNNNKQSNGLYNNEDYVQKVLKYWNQNIENSLV